MSARGSRVQSPVIESAAHARKFRITLNEYSFESSPYGIVVADMRQNDAPVVYTNLAFERLTGYSRREVQGKNPRFLQGADRQQPELDVIRRAIAARQGCVVTLRNYRKDGTLFWNQLGLAPVFDSRGRLTQYIGSLDDVTEYREAISQLKRLADFDALTELPSYERFQSNLAEILSRADGARYVTAVIRIGHLDEIGGLYGTNLGERVLRIAARRLMECPGCVAATRLPDGGFAIVVQLEDAEPAEPCVHALRDAFTQPYRVTGASISLFVSIGYAVSVAPAAAQENALQRASSAANQATLAGWGEVREFDATTSHDARARLRLIAEIRQAIEEEAFRVYYQPKVKIGSGEIVGAEALSRWRHPVFGLLPPSLFISAAEESGLIKYIGRSLLGEAAAMAARLNAGRPPEKALHIAINVARNQFQEPTLPDQLMAALETARAKPEWLVVELTEDLLVDVTPQILETFQAIRDMGIGLALDDFGSGYSSFRYLRDLPFTEVKIDRSFISRVDSHPHNASIVAAMLRMTRDLGIASTCEGVETPAERSALVKLGCVYTQGYLFSLPLDSDDFVWLVQHHDILPLAETEPMPEPVDRKEIS